MVKLLNSLLLALTGSLVLVCCTGLAFETCYKYALEIQLIQVSQVSNSRFLVDKIEQNG